MSKKRLFNPHIYAKTISKYKVVAKRYGRNDKARDIDKVYILEQDEDWYIEFIESLYKAQGEFIKQSITDLEDTIFIKGLGVFWLPKNHKEWIDKVLAIKDRLITKEVKHEVWSSLYEKKLVKFQEEAKLKLERGEDWKSPPPITFDKLKLRKIEDEAASAKEPTDIL